MAPKDKYTDPALRDEVKREVQESDKGGKPGQWSARKAQFMASEYKKRGGSYNTDDKNQDGSAANLNKWTEEEWTTADGSGKAKNPDGTENRYLPKEAWEEMDEGEKGATNRKKVQGSKEGKQFVGNTKGAKGKRAEVSGRREGKGGSKATNGNKNGEEDEDDSVEEEEEEEEEDEKQEDAAPKGRGTTRNAKSAVKSKVQSEMNELKESSSDEDVEQEDAEDGDFSAASASDDAAEDEEELAQDDQVDADDTGDAILARDGEVDESAEAEAERLDDEASESKAAQDDGHADKKDASGQTDDKFAKGAASAGRKRGRPNGQAKAARDGGAEGTPTPKKQKPDSSASADRDGTVGSKHDSAEAPAPAGSADRLPEVGQRVTWKALPGYVHGEVIEIVREDKSVRGKRIKGSEADPRIALQAESGKVAGHKPEACFYE